MIPIRSGEIAEDFAMYLADSEQTNSAVGLGVAIGTDLSVLAAGGFLVNVSIICACLPAPQQTPAPLSDPQF